MRPSVHKSTTNPTTQRKTKSPTAGERLVARVRQQLFQALIVQDISFFDSAKTGELMNRLAADTTGALVRSCVCAFGGIGRCYMFGRLT